MKVRKVLAAVVAAALSASAMAVSSFAALASDLVIISGAPTVNVYKLQGVENVDYSKVASIEAVVTTTDYVNGTIGVSVDGSWTTPGQCESKAGTTTWVLDGLTGIDATLDDGSLKEDVVQVQFWWLNAGSFSLDSLVLKDASGAVLHDAANPPSAEVEAPAEDTPAVETAEAPVEETVVVEETVEETVEIAEETVEIIETEETEPASTDLADYFDGSTVLLYGEDGGYLVANDMALTDVYGVKYYVTFDDAELADENVWVGGGVGANSDSTGWEQHEWGKASGNKEITPDFENGTITWYNGEPIFTEDETYAQLWIQTWGGTVTVDSVELLDANYVPETPTVEDEPVVDTEAPTTGDKQSPDTGVEGIAAVAGIVALAGVAVVASRKRK